MTNGADVLDQFLDLPEVFRPVAAKHGRALFTLVYRSGLAGEALEVIAATAKALNSAQLGSAAITLAESFNLVSSDYARLAAWPEASIQACNQEILAAFTSQIRAPKIVLNS